MDVGYVCSCGCRPSLHIDADESTAEDRCCCGTHFVVGPDAMQKLEVPAGFAVETTRFATPWGAQLEAAWAIGSGEHPDQPHDH